MIVKVEHLRKTKGITERGGRIQEEKSYDQDTLYLHMQISQQINYFYD